MCLKEYYVILSDNTLYIILSCSLFEINTSLPYDFTTYHLILFQYKRLVEYFHINMFILRLNPLQHSKKEIKEKIIIKLTTSSTTRWCGGEC